tara:strand:+ start:789 stop:896 length:108 start_codon:yes stop_codon:yes gene_type:complete
MKAMDIIPIVIVATIFIGLVIHFMIEAYMSRGDKQ